MSSCLAAFADGFNKQASVEDRKILFVLYRRKHFSPIIISNDNWIGGGFPNVNLIMSCLVAKDFLCSYNQGQRLAMLPQTLQGPLPARFARASSHAPTLALSQLLKFNTPFSSPGLCTHLSSTCWLVSGQCDTS